MPWPRSCVVSQRMTSFARPNGRNIFGGRTNLNSRTEEKRITKRDFLSAAQPTDQGEVSVVLLVVVVGGLLLT